MKQIFIVAALLVMNAAPAFAVSSNFEDPNNKFSETGKAYAKNKPCPLRNAAQTQRDGRLVHANALVDKPTFESRAKANGKLI